MRTNRLWALISPLAALLFLSGLGDASAVQPAATVTMTDQPANFMPARVTIKVGETVEWKNTGLILHSATDNPAEAAKPETVSAPPGAAPFDSGFMNPGVVYRHTFTVPGTYRYVCLPHQAEGMAGEIVVEPLRQDR